MTFAAERDAELCVARYRKDCRKLIEYIAGILKISQEAGDFLKIPGFPRW